MSQVTNSHIISICFSVISRWFTEPKAILLTFRWRLQCLRASSFNLESFVFTLKMMCCMKDATTSIPCHSDLKGRMRSLIQSQITLFFSSLLILPHSPDGVQLVQTAGAAEGSVLLTERSVQTRLQEFHPAHEGLTLLLGRHCQQFGLFDTHTKSENILHLQEERDIQ